MKTKNKILCECGFAYDGDRFLECPQKHSHEPRPQHTQCTCEMRKHNEPHEYTCKLNLCQMENKPQHTPTPWYWHDFGNGPILMSESKGRPVVLATVHKDARLCTNINGRLEPITIEHPNAAYIVRAVNENADLWRCLHGLRNEALHYAKTGKGLQHLLNEIQLTDSMLSKAEGE